jgi:hypothetical protein
VIALSLGAADHVIHFLTLSLHIEVQTVSSIEYCGAVTVQYLNFTEIACRFEMKSRTGLITSRHDNGPI